MSVIEGSEKFYMSTQQKKMWELTQNGLCYHLAVLKLSGTYDEIKMHEALRYTLNTFDALRITLHLEPEFKFPFQSEKHQRFYKFKLYEATDFEKQSYVDSCLKTFDYSQDCLLNVAVVRHGDHYKIYILIPGLAVDKYSMKNIIDTMFRFYSSTGSSTGSNVQYLQFSEWQHEQSESWRDEMQGLERSIDYSRIKELSSNFPRKSSAANVDVLKVILDSSVTDLLLGISKTSSLDTKEVLLTALVCLLYKHTGINSIVIGNLSSEREHEELASVVGLVSTTLPLQINVNDTNSFKEMCRDVSNRLDELNSISHLISDDVLFNDKDANLVYPVVFEYSDLTLEIDNGDNKVYLEDIVSVAPDFGIKVCVQRNSDTLEIAIYFNTGYHNKGFIDLFGDQLRELVGNLPESLEIPIESISICSKVERELILEHFNNTYKVFNTHANVIDMFEDCVDKNSERIALVAGGCMMTYYELNVKANKLARFLSRKCGITNGEAVGIILDHSPEVIVSILALLKSGAAYVPIDVSTPIERIKIVVQDAAISNIITNDDFDLVGLKVKKLDVQRLLVESEHNSEYNPKRISGPSDLAYIIFTSGSTGRPKGVRVLHSNLKNYVSWASDYYFGDNSDISFALFTSLAFDLTVTSIFTPLVSGGKIVVFKSIADVGQNLSQIFAVGSGITTVKLTPSHIRVLGQLELINSEVRHVIVGGEAMTEKHFEVLNKLNSFIEVYNEYGPTEATVGCTVKRIQRGSKITIGNPISNTSIYILDSAHTLLPRGIKGEIYISGLNVSDGYTGNGDLTKERFLKNPFGTGYMYRTGDYGRWLANGEIEYLGRKDSQIKINGYRIELYEIEEKLLRFKTVKECIVKLVEKSTVFLVAYYTSSQEYEPGEIREYLLDILPQYMIPSFYVHLPSMPLNKNGKIDKEALPDDYEREVPFEKPRNRNEEILVNIWQSVLGKEKISIYQNFFEAGGDSIKAIQIVSKLSREKLSVSVRDIFKNPVLSDLAEITKGQDYIPEQGITQGEVQLTPVQYQFFEEDLKYPQHFNQSVVLISKEKVETEVLRESISKVCLHHDNLRVIVDQVNISLFNPGADHGIELEVVEVKEVSEGSIKEYVSKFQSLFNMKGGALIKFVLLKTESQDYLFITAHHLLVDTISWQIIVEDINTAYMNIKRELPVKFPLKTTSFKDWAEKLQEYALTQELKSESTFWKKIKSTDAPVLASLEKASKIGDLSHFTFKLPMNYDGLKNVLLKESISLKDILLTGLSLAVNRIWNTDKVLIEFEGHGREEIFQNVNLSRTVGWFTSMFPVLLEVNTNSQTLDQIREVSGYMKSIPNNGIGYGILKYLSDESLDEKIRPEIRFNYHSINLVSDRVSQMPENVFSIYNKIDTGDLVSPLETGRYLLDIVVVSSKDEIHVSFSSNNTCEWAQLNYFCEAYRYFIKQCLIACELGTEDRIPELTIQDLPEKLVRNLNRKYRIEDIYPVSPVQEGMLYHYLTSKERSAYFEQVSYRVHTFFNKDVVKRALQILSQRHDMLRTVFIYTDTDQLLQLVQKDPEIEFYYDDLRGISESDQNEMIFKFKEQDRKRSFELNKGPLMRVALLRVQDAAYEIVWSHHHILMDGWCSGILTNEFFEIYNSEIQKREPRLTEPAQYKSYVQWLENIELSKASEFWKTYLDGYVESKGTSVISQKALNVPYVPESYQNELSEQETKQLWQLAGAYNVTPNTLLQVLWAIVLCKHNQSQDIVFGAVVSGRPVELQGMDSIVGLFVNTIPVRIQYSPTDTLKELLERVQNMALEASQFQYQSLSLIQALTPLKQQLFDHLFIFENYPLEDAIKDVADEQSGTDRAFRLASVDVFEQTNYNFNLVIAPAKKVGIKINYNSGIYLASEIESLFHRFRFIVCQALNGICNMSDFKIITPAEDEILDRNSFSRQISHTYDKTIIQLFEDVVSSQPHKKALLYMDKEISYSELNRQASNIASVLSSTGVRRNDLVAVLMNRSDAMVAVLLGILKVNAAYIPVDVNYPKSRIDYLLENSGARVVITESANKNLLKDTQIHQILADKIEDCPQVDFKSLPGSTDDLLYVVYTSGSTGLPKGVVASQKATLNRFNWMWDCYPFKDNEVCCQKTTLGFVDSVWEIFGPLLKGIPLLIIPDDVLRNISKFLNVLVDHRVTRLVLVPSLLRVILENTEQSLLDKLAIKDWIASGEKLENSLASLFYSKIPSAKLYNIYGASEVAADATISEVRPDESVNLGRPIDNAFIHVYGKDMKLLPPGLTGEICISGVLLAHGYLNNEEMTKIKFVDDPLRSGQKLYKTGDLGRWLSDGKLQYTGRMDSQVKLRGIRIELAEVELAISQFPGISQSIVMLDSNEYPNSLISFYVAKAQIDSSEIEKFIKTIVPAYMIPESYTWVKELPLTPHGKIDKNKLRDCLNDNARELDKPLNELEEKIIAIWKKVLRRNDIGVNDHFETVGGNSLAAIEVMLKINHEIKGIEAGVQDILNFPTVRLLSDSLKEKNKKSLIINLKTNENANGSIFFIPPLSGTSLMYKDLSHNITSSHNCYGLQYKGFDYEAEFDESIEMMAESFCNEIMNMNLNGDIFLCGFSMGVMIAFELAKLIRKKSDHSVRLILLDLGTDLKTQALAFTEQDINIIFERQYPWMRDIKLDSFDRVKKLCIHNNNILKAYRTNDTVDCDFLAIESLEDKEAARMEDWTRFIKGKMTHVYLKTNHDDFMTIHNLTELSKKINAYVN